MNTLKQASKNQNGSKLTAIISVLLGTIFALVVGLASSTESLPSVIQHQIIISGFEFVPKELNVSVGDRITWINKDIVPHNIATNSEKTALSPELANGESFSLTVKDSLSYICGLHPSMQGKLIIKN
jgi:plastocyanin